MIDLMQQMITDLYVDFNCPFLNTTKQKSSHIQAFPQGYIPIFFIESVTFHGCKMLSVRFEAGLISLVMYICQSEINIFKMFNKFRILENLPFLI